MAAPETSQRLTRSQTRSKTNIDDLPPEILQKIMDYLDVPQLHRCRMVSTRWNEVGNSMPPTYWQHVCLRKFPVTTMMRHNNRIEGRVCWRSLYFSMKYRMQVFGASPSKKRRLGLEYYKIPSIVIYKDEVKEPRIQRAEIRTMVYVYRQSSDKTPDVDEPEVEEVEVPELDSGPAPAENSKEN